MQRKEVNNRMEKNRNLFTKSVDLKGTFHSRMGMIKDRTSKEVKMQKRLVKKRWVEYTEELYRKGLKDMDNHKGMVIHSELNILECEVKWALGIIAMNKASGGNGIPVELKYPNR